MDNIHVLKIISKPHGGLQNCYHIDSIHIKHYNQVITSNCWERQTIIRNRKEKATKTDTALLISTSLKYCGILQTESMPCNIYKMM